MSKLPEGDEGCDDEDIKEFLSNAEINVAPNVKWEDIYGIQQAVDKVKECILLPAKFPQLFTGDRRPEWSGLLLYGAPGCGKTLLVQAAIAELISYDTLCFRISAYELLSKWQKNPIKAMQAMFKKAKGYKHSVFFIDDIEVLSQQSEETELSARLKTEFRTQVDNIRTNCRECILCFVGVTNKPWKLAHDYSLQQMLDERVYLPLPDVEARCAIFKQQLTSVQHSISEEHVRMLAERSVGFSGSDIIIAARDASMEPVRRIQAATHFKHSSGPSPQDSNKVVDDLLIPCSQGDLGAIAMTWSQIEENKLFTPLITVEDAMKSLSGVKPSVSEEDLDMYRKFTEEWGII